MITTTITTTTTSTTSTSSSSYRLDCGSWQTPQPSVVSVHGGLLRWQHSALTWAPASSLAAKTPTYNRVLAY